MSGPNVFDWDHGLKYETVTLASSQASTSCATRKQRAAALTGP